MKFGWWKVEQRQSLKACGAARCGTASRIITICMGLLRFLRFTSRPGRKLTRNVICSKQSIKWARGTSEISISCIRVLFSKVSDEGWNCWSYYYGTVSIFTTGAAPLLAFTSSRHIFPRNMAYFLPQLGRTAGIRQFFDCFAN